MKNFDSLEKNICDTIKEIQVKLGYEDEPTRLYYPLKSLNRILGTKADVDRMKEYLEEFVQFIKPRLGDVTYGNNIKRFSFIVPRSGVRYIRDNVEFPEYIIELIEALKDRKCDSSVVQSIFSKYSENVRIIRSSVADIDFTVFFEGGVPDDYKYCFHREGDYLIYHRFKNADYEDIIDLEHPEPKKHTRMSASARAAQFAPFAALTGHSEAIEETAREVDSMIELTEDEVSRLEEKLNTIISNNITDEISIEYFVPDEKKDGGCYVTKIGAVARVKEFEKIIILSDGTKIPMQYVRSIDLGVE